VPSVSIVLPTRDRPERLLTALQAVARQDHQELQLILVRDGGAPLTDEARGAIRALGFPTTIVEHDGPAEGTARARNRGVEAARGDSIALLDDDDDWTSDHVRRLATALDRDDKADVVYSDVRIVREDDGSERLIARDFNLSRFTRDGYVPPSSLLARRAAFAGFGLSWAALRQDGTDYFDYHHTPDDTLDKIDPKALAQNVAAYAVFAYLAADAQGDFGSKPGKVTPPHE